MLFAYLRKDILHLKVVAWLLTLAWPTVICNLGGIEIYLSLGSNVLKWVSTV